MKLYSAYVFLCSTLSIILASAQSCGFSSTPETNATDSISLNSPFQPPSGLLSSPARSGSNIWRWTLAMVSSDKTIPNTTVENRLWLDTQPSLDLVDPSFGYLGCGAVIHGLNHDALVNGQADPGNCSSVFNEKCLNAVLGNAQIQSEYINEYTYLHENHPQQIKTAYERCADLGRLYGQNNAGLPPECSDSLNGDAWVDTFVFASPQTNTICPGNPSAGNVSHPLIAWGDVHYSDANLLAYNQSAVSVTPLLISMVANRSVEASPNFAYTEQHLLCFRPENFGPASVHPTEVPSTASLNRLSIAGAGLGSLLLAVLFS